MRVSRRWHGGGCRRRGLKRTVVWRGAGFQELQRRRMVEIELQVKVVKRGRDDAGGIE
jgi:hypothetical protein